MAGAEDDLDTSLVESALLLILSCLRMETGASEFPADGNEMLLAVFDRVARPEHAAAWVAMAAAHVLKFELGPDGAADAIHRTIMGDDT